MGIIFHFFLGFVTSFLGTLFPSMLSLTTVKISLKESKKKAIYFAAGVSVVVLIQAYIAIAFSKVLLQNPRHLDTLQIIGVVIFTILSIYFFRKAFTSKKESIEEHKRKANGFVTGMFFSTINMFAIPFYVGITASLALMQWYTFEILNNMCFVIGSSAGTFSLMFLYAQLAIKVEKRILWLANKIDLFLAIVIALAAILNAIDILI